MSKIRDHVNRLLGLVLASCPTDKSKKFAEPVKDWIRSKIDQEGIAWVSQLIERGVKDGAFDGLKKGRGQGKGIMIPIEPKSGDRLFYLLVGQKEGLSVKATATAIKMDIPWTSASVVREKKLQQYMAMRPALVLLNEERLPEGLFGTFWRSPEERKVKIPAEIVEIYNSHDWIKLLRTKRKYRDLFPLGINLEPPKNEAEYLGILTDSKRYTEAHQSFTSYVDRLLLESKKDGRVYNPEPPEGQRGFLVHDYEIRYEVSIGPPGVAMTLLQQAHSHVYALAMDGRLDDNLRVCANHLRCTAKYFFPWTSNHLHCGSACRSALQHLRRFRKR